PGATRHHRDRLRRHGALHVSRPSIGVHGARLDGLLRGRRMTVRAWAVVPVILLAATVGAFVTSGASLVELIGRSPPSPDEFDIRRVKFEPGAIKIRVTNPQRDDLTIASVTVDGAILPFTADGSARLDRLRT